MAAQSSRSHHIPEEQKWQDVQAGEAGSTSNGKPVLEKPYPGSCAYKELKSGVECGCQRFWKKNDYEKTSCFCGHHLCYHTSTASVDKLGLEQPSNSLPSDLNTALLEHLTQLSKILSAAVQPIPAALPANSTVQGAILGTITDDTAVVSSGAAEDRRAITSVPQAPITQSTTSTSYQPRLPAGCQVPDVMLPQALRDTEAGRLYGHHPSAPANAAGLGLWLSEVAAVSGSASTPIMTANQRSLGDGASDELRRALRLLDPSMASSDGNVPSTRQQTGESSEINLRQQLLPALDMVNFPQISGFEDFLQSATELATPTVGTQTPDLNIPAAAIRPSIETAPQQVTHPLTPSRMLPPEMPHVSNGTPSLPPGRSLATPMSQMLSPPPVLGKEPQNIRDIGNHLRALRQFLSTHGTHIKGLGDRLDAIERVSSFSQIPRDQDVMDKLEMIETRMIEIEGKVDDVRGYGGSESSKLHLASFAHKRHNQLRENASVGSNQSSQSLNSATSSAVALSGDRNAIKVRIDSLDERVTDLEKSLPPSFTRPLEIEVVFIPWGRELRGVWVNPEDNFKIRQSSKLTTQDSEDWATGQGLRSSSRTSASLRSGAESGWTSQAIHEWAEDADEWLVPRACGLKSVVYHRLKSRGFVQNVELNKPGAKEIQETVSKAFEHLLGPIETRASARDEGNTTNESSESYWGLKARFIPLRKIHRSSRLRFLAKSEMLTPTLWSAEFLLSSVIMHATGGLKRLFITHKQAYLQPPDLDYQSWTWKSLRELPRVKSDSGHVEEADAREVCWADHPVLDAPPLSVNTSFASHVSSSSHLSHSHNQATSQEKSNNENRQNSVKSESNSGYESEVVAAISKNNGPITPVTEQNINNNTQEAIRGLLALPHPDWHDFTSEDDSHPPSTPHPANFQIPFGSGHGNQPRYNLRTHMRHASNPLSGVSVAGPGSGSSGLGARPTRASQRLVGASVRRITRSFSTPSNPLIATLPSFVPSSPNRPPRGTGGSSGNKRRRIDRSVSAEEYTSSKARRSRSASIMTFVAQPHVGKKGKRAITPVGPYMTPYSGNFGSGYMDGSGGARTAGGESDDGEVWEGVVDDDHRHETLDQLEHSNIVHDFEQNDDDIPMDDEEESDEDNLSNYMDATLK